MNAPPTTLSLGPVQAVPLLDTAVPKLRPLLPTTVIKPVTELMSVELDCRRDVNAPEFIIAGVPKVTAGAGGGGGAPNPIEIPLPKLIPGPTCIAMLNSHNMQGMFVMMNTIFKSNVATINSPSQSLDITCVSKAI